MTESLPGSQLVIGYRARDASLSKVLKRNIIDPMSGKEVLEIYSLLEQHGIKIWIDGGWAVDALLGEQTRSHQDLDIAVQHTDLTKLELLLEAQGYKNIPREEDKMWDLVMINNEGKVIEVHAFSFDSSGRVVEEEYWDGYSDDSLEGEGIIEDKKVRCVSLAQLIKTHDGSQRNLKESDREDMRKLSDKFGVVFSEK